MNPAPAEPRKSRAFTLYLSYFRQAYELSPVLTIATACTALTGSMIPLGNVAVIGIVVGRIPAAVQGGPDSAATGSALMWTVLAGVLLAVQFVLGGLQTALTTVLGNRIDLAQQRRLMTAAMRPVGIADLERPQIASLVAVGGETMRPWLKPGRVAGGFCALFTARVGQFGGCVLLAAFSPVLAAALLCASLWAEYEIQKVAKRETAHHLGANQLARRQDYFYELAVTPAAAKEIRVFDLSGFLRERFADSWQQSARFLFAQRQPRSVLATVLLAAITLGGLGWLTGRALDGAIGIGWASAYAQAIVMAAAMLAATTLARTQSALGLDTFARFEAAVAAMDRAGRADPVEGTGAVPAQGLPQREIRFENVGFRYSDSAPAVLDALDLTVPAGESLAIVGANGTGKTTLVKLLCRLYEPVSGRITVDGRPLRDLSPEPWQRAIAPVFQDYLRFELSARSNIGLGHPARQDDLEGIRAAAAEAGIADRIDVLADGWDTVLSPGHKRGTDLSGGEWQRLALARALFAVRHGAKVLVLDEPAANLDARAEAELYRQFLTITEGLTTIVISHRFSTVRQAASIIVLSEGRVAEQGTHDELVAQGGQYAKMFRLQAARFHEVPTT
ncbi:ABC transporter ATP-binding protein [Streptomyces sp. MZ04]|uniref:ABC transporter ATP-binding protein n=1 Tax=Streptomyces sp. MZ04 TaxID=2559236 RepID=UPI00107E79C6|nr:ABC transporter ATP-binding protein [Streptomyces sp. MZ04]TGB15136.1 ABC transporter ATP-binding protein [Streptomyces sp. MZ04]